MTFGSVFGRTFSPTFQPKSQAVIAASTFVPTDISGCKLWLDFSDADTLFTDAGSTKVSSDGDAIYQVNDKSGSSNHFVQADSNKRPLYKTNILNSLSACLFDGSNDCLTKTNNWTDYDKATLFIAYTSSASATKVFFEHGNAGGGNGYGQWSEYHSSNRKVISIISGTGGTQYSFYTSTAAITTKGILSVTFDIALASNEIVSYINGSGGGSYGTNNNPTGTLGNLRTNLGARNDGASFPFSGYMYEVVLYLGSVLDSTNLGIVNTYLNNKWAIY